MDLLRKNELTAGDLDRSSALMSSVAVSAAMAVTLPSVSFAARASAGPLDPPPVKDEEVGWVECRRCGKWRMLEIGVNDWRGAFYCEMNKWSPAQDACHKLEDPAATTPRSPSKSPSRCNAHLPSWKASDCIKKNPVVDFKWSQCVHCKYWYMQNHTVCSAPVADKKAADLHNGSSDGGQCAKSIVSQACGDTSSTCARAAFLEEQIVPTDTPSQTQLEANQKETPAQPGADPLSTSADPALSTSADPALSTSADPALSTSAEAHTTATTQLAKIEVAKPLVSFEIKQLVIVADRTGHGLNKQGGTARISACNADGTYNVTYVLGGREKKYVIVLLLLSDLSANAVSCSLSTNYIRVKDLLADRQRSRLSCGDGAKW
jgi:hypothetical protein